MLFRSPGVVAGLAIREKSTGNVAFAWDIEQLSFSTGNVNYSVDYNQLNPLVPIT